MKISVIGCGWYGTPLAQKLVQVGHRICGTTRTGDKKDELQKLNIQTELLNPPDLLPMEVKDCDVMILNIPPFKNQLEWFKSWKIDPKVWIIFISSTSLYPQPETENAHILIDQEEWLKSTFHHWTILRFGGLLGNGRHPGKHLAGRKNLQGRLAPVNLLHLDDAIGFTQTVLEKNLKNETFHVVSSQHPMRENFYTDFAKRNNLPLPEFDQTDHSPGKMVPNDQALLHDPLNRWNPDRN